VSDLAAKVSAVVVDYHADDVLGGCIDSLRRNGIDDVVVVENGAVGSTPPALGDRSVTLVTPGLNLGYGRGVNRGAAATTRTEFLLVSNPDVVVHDGAIAELLAALEEHPNYAIAGPRILRPDGSVYPSHRVFPNMACTRCWRPCGQRTRQLGATALATPTARWTGCRGPAS